jgi:hypothetical protein
MYLNRIASVCMLVLVSLVSAQTTEIADYPFTKKINISTSSNAQSVAVELDAETLNAINNRFSNVGIYNTKNEAIPFTVLHEPPARVRKLTITDISSVKGEDTKPEWLFDQDINTTFMFDKRVDKKNPATVTVDLGTDKRLNRIEIFVPDHARIYKMALFGGNNPNDLQRIMSERPFVWQTDFRSEPVRYLKIALWGFRVDVNDIRLSYSHTGKVFFTAAPDDSLVFAYGGNRDHISYENRIGTSLDTDVSGKLEKRQWNKLFAADVDTDGIENKLDNCPFAHNRGQSDRDGDSIGDVCDNALNTKNYDQSDIDKDGVGDLIDNCKLKPNPKQKNADGDSFGDLCDVAYNDPKFANDTEDSSFNKMTVLYSLLSLLAVFLLGYAYYANRKK